MKTKIVPLVTLISIILTIISLIFGIAIWKINILSTKKLSIKNQNVNDKISEANKYITEEYPKYVSSLDDTYSQYKDSKNHYKELIEISDSENKDNYETKKYDITYLWKKLGSYATNRNLWLGIDVKNNINLLYDFNFTIKGDYVDIIQYITDIENDSEFYFRIYNFSMTEGIATFTVKDINVNSNTINS